MLAGREADIDNFRSLIERLGAGSYERSLMYSGLRGVGKTVLLMEFDLFANEAGWATTDVQEVGSQPDFRITFARMAARLLRVISPKQRVLDRVRRALGVVTAFSLVAPALRLTARQRASPRRPESNVFGA
ncbi:MAG: ATP-binding protein [Candidatus Dormibacteraeota bacterium]|uniref:ATP-binding protein n=1 Tax=Candidatus Amunia macphersoniae TaxID=3127014 RepID=A0A934NGA5_9BACT|nr:ATP-binding protein [Candidatus Dormibacteraeota bacterium]